MIRIFFNPLDAKSVVEYPIAPGTQLINFLQSEYPVGFDGSLRVFVGNQELDLIDLDYEVQELDQITMLVMPSGGAFAVAAGKILITALVSAAIGYAINLIFAPKTPSFGDEPSESLVYTLNPTRNAIRLGEPISVSYGTVSAPPPYGSAPYSFYWEGSNDQYVDQLMVLGQGKFEEVTVDDIFIGDTPLSAIADGSVRYWVFDSDFHQQQLGRIGDYITDQTSGGYAPWPFYENVYLSPEASDLNFEEQKNEEAGAVAISGIAYAGTATAPGRIEGVDSSLLISGGDTIVLSGTTSNNISFVVGSVAPNPDDNSEMTVWQQYNSTNLLVDENPLSGTFTTNPADAGGDSPGMTHGPFRCQKLGTQVDRVDCDIIFPQGLFRVDGTSGKIKTNTMELEFTYQAIDEETGLPIGLPIVQTKSWLSKSRVALRATISSGKLTAGHYECTVRRITPMHDDSRKTDQVTWTGLKGNVTIDRNAKAYGDVSIICFRLLATNALGEAARSRIRVVTTRILESGESNNPITAIKDQWTNTTYGLGFSPDLLDPAMDVLETFWADPLGPKFNGSYDTKSTGFDSMQSAASFAGAKVVNNGQLTNVVADGIQDVRHAMFSTANIVRDSLEIIYSFDTLGDYTGNSVSYRDPLTFDEQFVFSPEQTENPENFTLFGCTDKEYAQRMANYLWNVKTDRRQLIKFDTELEGLIPSFGQRIGVSSPMPDWGQSGVFVQMVDALTWIVDQPLEWSETEDNVIIIRGNTGLPSSPYTVTQGSSRNVVVFGEVPPIVDQQGQEPTNYAFGTSTQNMTDWIVTKISPKGDNIVGIEAQIYKPEVFVDVPCQMTAYAECVDCKVYECDAFEVTILGMNPLVYYDFFDLFNVTPAGVQTTQDLTGNGRIGGRGGSAGCYTDAEAPYDCDLNQWSQGFNGVDSLLGITRDSNTDPEFYAAANDQTFISVIDLGSISTEYRGGTYAGNTPPTEDGTGGVIDYRIGRQIIDGRQMVIFQAYGISPLTGENESGNTGWIDVTDTDIFNDDNTSNFFLLGFGYQQLMSETFDTFRINVNGVEISSAQVTNGIRRAGQYGNEQGLCSLSWGLARKATASVSFNLARGGIISGQVSAEDMAILYDAYIRTFPDYVDPRPECTPCLEYECDAISNYIESLAPPIYWKFDQGGVTPSLGVNDVIRSDGTNLSELTITSNYAYNNPEQSLTGIEGIDTCDSTMWYVGAPSQDFSTFQWNGTNYSAGYENTFPAATESVTMYGLNRGSSDDGPQSRYHYLSLQGSAQACELSYVQGGIYTEYAGSNVTWPFATYLLPEEGNTLNLIWVVIVPTTGDNFEHTLYINGTARGSVIDNGLAVRKAETYYGCDVTGNENSYMNYMGMFDREVTSIEMDGIAAAYARNQSTFVDPRPECQ